MQPDAPVIDREDSVMNEAIRTKVTEQGVLIPRTLLEGMDEVEIRKENGIITVMPAAQTDPISHLGEHPVECGAPDASEQHDKYLYGASP